MNEIKTVPVNDIRHPIEKLQKLVEYWLSICGDGKVARSRDFDLVAIPEIVDSIAIYELPEDGDFIFRYNGSSLAYRLGAEATGRKVSKYVAAEMWKATRLAWLDYLTIPCGAIVSYINEIAGGAEVKIHTILLPLEDDQGKCRQIVAAFSAEDINGSVNLRAKEIPRIVTEFDPIVRIDLGFGTGKMREASG